MQEATRLRESPFVVIEVGLSFAPTLTDVSVAIVLPTRKSLTRI
jgi:hypothetical protein